MWVVQKVEVAAAALAKLMVAKSAELKGVVLVAKKAVMMDVKSAENLVDVSVVL